MDAIALANRLDAEFRTTCAAVNRDEPWFGSLEVLVDGKRKAYRIGKERLADHRVIDWRHPLARLYYDHAPGEPFEIEGGGRGYVAMEGVVDAIAALGVRDRTVRRVDVRATSGRAVVVAGDDGFRIEEATPRRGPETGLPDVLALLTPEQYRLITSSRTSPVIIQGRAGSGKTSVALHRVSWMTYADETTGEAPVDPAKVLIVMFNKALSLFVRAALRPLKLEAATLDTFHGWALGEIRRAYQGDIQPDPTPREGHEVAAALKKQVGILRAIDAFVLAQTRAVEAWLAEKLAPYRAGAWVERFRASKGPVRRRLVSLRDEATAARNAARGVEQARLAQVHAVFRQAVTRMSKYKEELWKLLTDEALLSDHLTASATEIATLARYQRSLQGDGAADGRVGPKVAFEDLALILRLIEVKNGGLADKERDDEVRVFDHLVVDEAQDFGAVELAVLFSAVKSRTGVTIVGDLNQKILPEVDFIGWDALAEELGIGGAKVTRLEVAHRSTRPIMALADALVGDETQPGREGPTPTLTLVEDDEQKLARAAAFARAALTESPHAHVCVVCRWKKEIEATVAALARELGSEAPVRAGHNDRFEFAPGVTVTNYRQVKGLEFDTVIVLDPTGHAYPATTQGRRNLYMVVTRAKDALHLVAVREATPLLSPAIAAGLVELHEETSVPEVAFTEADDAPF